MPLEKSVPQIIILNRGEDYMKSQIKFVLLVFLLSISVIACSSNKSNSNINNTSGASSNKIPDPGAPTNISSTSNVKPVGNGTSLIDYDGYLYCVNYNYSNDLSMDRLYRINKITGEKYVLTSSCYSDIWIYSDRLYYILDSKTDKRIVCSMALDGTDNLKLMDGELSYLDDQDGMMYVTQDANNHDNQKKLIKTDAQGKNVTLINDNINSFISGDTNGKILYATTGEDNTNLHYINSETGKDSVIDHSPAGTAFLNYRAIPFAKTILDKVYYAFGEYQGSGQYWYGDIYVTNLDGSATECLIKDAGEKFFIIGNDLYFTLDEHKEPNNQKLDLISGKTVSSKQSIFDIYDGDKTVYFDNSSKSKLILGSKIIGSDLFSAKIVISLDKNINPNITQAIQNISVVGDWICFQVANVNYNDPLIGSDGEVFQSRCYIVKKDGTALQLLNN